MTYLPPTDALLFDPDPAPLTCGSAWCMRHGPLGSAEQRCTAERRPVPAQLFTLNPVTGRLETPGEIAA